MSRSYVGSFIVLAAAVLASTPVSAQRALASERNTVSRDSYADRLLARPVTLRLDNVTVRNAVESIAEQANVRIVYRSDLLPPGGRKVSVHATQQPLGAVLEGVLVGTNLQVVVTAVDGLALRAVETAPPAQGAIVGKVTGSKTKRPVSGATVLLDDAKVGVMTGDDGTFRLLATPGSHTVTVRALGSVKQTRSVTVTEGQDVMVDFVLEPSTSVLDEVIVTGTVIATERKAIPTPITVITAEDIQKRGITRVDQLLRGEVPGVMAMEPGTRRYDNNPESMVSTQVYVRGVADLENNPKANPLKTYVDGVELLDPSYLGTIDPQSIERIEIITGPQAATIYGSGAMGGVMQIFTKKGNGHATPDLTLSLKYGVLENNFTNGRTPAHTDVLNLAGGVGAMVSYSGTLSYGYTGQWQPALFSRTYSGSLGATLTQGPVTVGGSVALVSGLNGTAGGSNIPFGAVIENQAKRNGDWNVQATGYFAKQQSRQLSQTLTLSADYRPTAIWQHHLTLGRVQNTLKLDPVAPAFRQPSDSMLWTTGRDGERQTTSYNMTLAPRFGSVTSTIALGVDGSKGNQLSTDGYLPEPAATQYVYPYLTKTIDDQHWGGFASWQLGLFDRLYFTAGARGERNPTYGRAHRVDWTPRAGVTYTLEHNDLTVKLLASAGRATRAPTEEQRRRLVMINPAYTPAQYIYQFESPDLKPEYSHGPQGGIELYYGNIGSLSINRYVQIVDNLIQGIPVDSFWVVSIYGYSFYYQQTQNQNVAKMRQHGWEGTASLNLGPLSFKGTYSWNDSRVQCTTYSWQLVGETFRYVPTHSGNLTVSYARGGTSVVLVNNYVGTSVQDAYRTYESYATSFSRMKMYLSRYNSPSYSYYNRPGYVKSDLAISQRLNGWSSAIVNVTNLGNSFAGEGTNISPTLGRQTQFGVSMRFPTKR